MARMLRWIAVGLLAAATAQATTGDRWTTAWWTSQLALEGQNALPAADLTDATLRQIVRLQGPASRLRVRFSNRFGTAPLRIDGATIARAVDAASPRIDVATLRPLRFGGASAVVIPAGADYWSDPVVLEAAPGSDLAISLHMAQPPSQQTGHPGSRATSYVLHGDHGGDADLAGAKTVDHWFQIAGIEAVAPRTRAIVAFGDSITDGYGVKPNTNARWTDALQRRLRQAPGMGGVAVLNAGIGGNRLLNDGLGPNALARFDHDVIGQPGVSHLIVLEGVNDLGTLTRDAPVPAEAHAALVSRMIDAYRQIVARAHARGIKVIGATIMPYAGSGYYHPDAQNEADRQAVNRWIRTPGNFDAVIDFDAAMRDPADPKRLRKDYDSGDGLHPSVTGYAAMASAVPLALLR
ncbi:SGNH/GDSL hydrolase family protein [Sphingomonas sp. R1]|uniref:SGNH/GDSL hydrolase family protein n=1 Tax=Sphingomonas sp. R1 TaxID=399176 RepID=UPI002224B216|nr:SGNH/GDSL hydrolase family protein [Sphingomonas sp. R1]UYY78230.1 SGNH/GDSL hydrolase family protein [Sphingomonas sp. R1]